MSEFISTLRHNLSKVLPGLEAQMQMAAPFYKKHRSLDIHQIQNKREAATLALLYQRDAIWYTALMQRPSTNHAHSGQVSFPGGKVEKEDTDYAYTAKRETFEEFGIPIENIHILGQLSPLFIPVSSFLVYPFVAYLEENPIFTPDQHEVEAIIEVPLEELLKSKNRQFTNINLKSGLILENVPYFALEGKVVWGATAMMLSEWVEVLQASIPAYKKV